MAWKWEPFLVMVHFLTIILQIRSEIPALIIFGDSSVDPGNNNQIPTIAKSDFEPYGRDFAGGQPTGRFSNGRIATDFISEAFGLRSTVPAYLDPTYNISDFAVGVSFASAGTGYDNATSDVLRVIPLWKQLEYYKEYQMRLNASLGVQNASRIISTALHMTSMGTNDFLENYYTMPGRRSQYTIDEYQDFLVGVAKNFTVNLYNLGARKFSIGGLPPMGCMPLERATNMANGNECVESYNIVAMNFNAKLNASVMNLKEQLPEAELVFSNPYNIMLQIIRRPSLYGFDVASMACCATGMFEMGYTCNRYNPFTCTDANKYVFWDSFHPTERTNYIVSSFVVNKVLKQFL